MSLVQLIGIVGAGQMGRGIAQVAAGSGFEVIIFDLRSESLKIAQEFINSQLKKSVEKGRYTSDQMDLVLKNLSYVESLDKLKQCDLIIEAATENPKIKFEIFKQLDLVIKPSAILATNTSSISITEIASHTNRADKVCGMHFMNPVPVMKLVEGIRGLKTSDETFQIAQSVSEKMGKTFVKAKDYPGFTVNRILMPMINEAIYALYESVASAKDIDVAMKLGTNQPMGPLELADFIGLDTCLAIMNVLHDGLGDTKYRACPLLKQYVSAGKLGRKTKSGFFDY